MILAAPVLLLTQADNGHIGLLGCIDSGVEPCTVGAVGLSSLYKFDLRIRKFTADSLQQRGHFRRNAVGVPPAKKHVAAVGHRADYGDLPDDLRIERKQWSRAYGVVLQQNHRLDGEPAGNVERFLREKLWRRVGGIRGVEQPQLEFHAQDAAHGIVEPREGHRAVFHQFGQIAVEGVTAHVHIQTGVDGLCGGIGEVFGKSLRNKLRHGIPVGHHESGKLPALLENLGEGAVVGGAGHAVDIVERTHHRGGSGIDTCFIGWKIGVPEGLV